MFAKRLLLAVPVLTLALLLTWPSLILAQPHLQASPQRRATAVGIVRPIPEVTICQQGATHILVDSTGTWMYQLVSSTINLGQYEGQRVRVIGRVEERIEGCPPLLTVFKVVPPPSRR